jgi:hypothetical protein
MTYPARPCTSCGLFSVFQTIPFVLDASLPKSVCAKKQQQEKDFSPIGFFATLERLYCIESYSDPILIPIAISFTISMLGIVVMLYFVFSR